MTDGPGLPTHADGPMVFVDSLDAPEIDPQDYHHLSRVLRVRDGSPMVVCDGAGNWARARLGEVVEVDGPTVSSTPTPLRRVGFALTKGDKPELAVQKLTELGVDHIAVFASAHSVVRWDEARRDRQVERFRKIARESSMQCRRTALPEIGVLPDFGSAEFDTMVTASPPGSFVLADMEAERHLLDVARDVVAQGGDLPMVLVGPEGGWSDVERRSGLTRVRIARHVLRAETAAITVGALLAAVIDAH